MPIERVAGGDAINRLKTEGRRVRWPDHREPDRRMEGLVTVTTKPSFEIRKGDRIFTMGSCFARNIERRLTEIGFDTVMYDQGLIDELKRLDHGLEFMNKYNSASIRAEIGWALGVPRPAEEHVLLPVGDGGAHDLFATQNKKLACSLEKARAARRLIEQRVAKIADCRIVILTLGLAEVWYDSVSGLHFNAAPPASAIRAEPDRFFLDVYSYDEILADLEAIHALLSKGGHPDVHMLITVSPVPMHMTFRALDAMTANSYSKSVQRAALEAFVCAHDNVDYFPSFEPVTLTDRRIAFDPDNRHVQPGIVSRIVDQFMALYAPKVQFAPTSDPLQESRAATARDFLVSARLHHEQRQYREAADYYQQALGAKDESLDAIRVSRSSIHAHLAGCHYKMGDMENSRLALEACVSGTCASARDLLSAARLASRIKAFELGHRAMARAAALGASEEELAPVRLSFQEALTS